MKMTLLQIVQLLLSSMDSDEVNSINDTTESYDLALMLRSLYYETLVELNLPEHSGLFELIPSTDITKPVLMTVPTNVSRIDWIKYDTKTLETDTASYTNIPFYCFEEFFQIQKALEDETENVGSMNVVSNGEFFPFMYRTDGPPTKYTTVGDNQLIFDSYDSVLEDTLQKNKTMCHGVFYPVFSLTDTYIPDMDAVQFPYFLNRAKERAFVEKKQISNQEAQSSSRHQKIVLQKRKFKTKPQEQNLRPKPLYGRK